MALPSLLCKAVHCAVQPRLRHSDIGRATGFQPLRRRLVLRSPRLGGHNCTCLSGERDEAQPGQTSRSGLEQLAASAPSARLPVKTSCAGDIKTLLLLVVAALPLSSSSVRRTVESNGLQ